MEKNAKCLLQNTLNIKAPSKNTFIKYGLLHKKTLNQVTTSPIQSYYFIKTNLGFLIIGAGLAGTSSAYALAKQGYEITIVDSADHIAAGASGNDQGILYTKMSVDNTSLANRFYLSSYLYAVNHYKNLQKTTNNLFWFPTGVTQLASTSKESLRQQDFLKKTEHLDRIVYHETSADITDRLQINIPTSGLVLPQAGWINPKVLCSQYLASIQGKVNTLLHHHVDKIEWKNDSWMVTGLNRSTNAIFNWEFPIIVIANATKANELINEKLKLPIKSIRGQTTLIHESKLSANISQAICSNSYILPKHGQHYCIGATFNLGVNDHQLRSEDHVTNLQNLELMIPSLLQNYNHNDNYQGRVGFRCATSDYSPIVGPLPDISYFRKHYGFLKHDRKKECLEEPQYFPGLYVNVGHGSKGLTSTPLCAEILSSMISQRGMPIEKELIHTILPSRFFIKRMIRGLE